MNLFKSNMMIIFMMFIIFLAMGSLSASQDISDGNQEDLSCDEDNVKISAENFGNKFNELQNAVADAEENDVVVLEGNYVFEKSVNINKNLTVQGSSGGATLDFNNKDYSFYVACVEEKTDDEGYSEDVYKPVHVIFKNINFINSRGAILSENANITVMNCNFINNSIPFEDYGGGAAIHTNDFDENYLLGIYDSKFINCSGFLAGAVLAGNVLVKNSTFENNFASMGGAISASYARVYSSKFIKNRATYGGALFVEYGLADVGDCEFSGNYAEGYGSAILTGTPDDLKNSQVALNLSNSEFNGNTAKYNAVSGSDMKYKDMGAGAVVVDSYGGKPKYSICNCSGLDKTFVKTPITIVAPKVSAVYNSAKTFTVKVISKNTKKAVSKCYVELTGDSIYKKAYTNSKGIATFKLKNIGAGTHKVTVKTYMKYSPAKTTSTIKISKASATVKAPKVANGYKKSKYFKVTVKSLKNPVKKLKVKIKVFSGKKSKTYTVTTDGKGTAQFNTKVLSKGTHKVTVSSGSKNYLFSAKSTIVIK